MQTHPLQAQVMQSADALGSGEWKEVDTDCFKKAHLSLSCFFLNIYFISYCQSSINPFCNSFAWKNKLLTLSDVCVSAEKPRQGWVDSARLRLRLFTGLPQKGRVAFVLVAGRSSNIHQHIQTASGPCIRAPANVPGLLMSMDRIPENTKALSKCEHAKWSSASVQRVGPLRTPRNIFFSLQYFSPPWVLATVSFLHLAPFSLASCFFQFPQVSLPTWFLESIIPPGQGTLPSHHTSELFSLALICFLLCMTHKTQRFLLVATRNLNTFSPEWLSTEQGAPNHISADCHCWWHHINCQFGETCFWLSFPVYISLFKFVFKK